VSEPKKIRSNKIADPVSHFAEWVFAIGPHHYPALGVTWRKFMFKKEPFYSFAADNPLRPDFQVGDVFYSADLGGTRFLQVAVAGGDGMVEVHCGLVGLNLPRDGYLLWDVHLAEWLQSGVIPDQKQEVFLGTSQAGLLAWQLVKPDGVGELVENKDALVVG
jgi:hypothetical protein